MGTDATDTSTDFITAPEGIFSTKIQEAIKESKENKLVRKLASKLEIQGTVVSRPNNTSIIEGPAILLRSTTRWADQVALFDSIVMKHDKVILLTDMTTPDILPFIHKLCGIVASQGGILCHAAIISREFGIPCIVGAKEKMTNRDYFEILRKAPGLRQLGAKMDLDTGEVQFYDQDWE